MIIKNTDGSHCAIKEIKIYGMKALITLIIYSSVPQTTEGNRVFNFYLKDFDKNTLLPLSNNNYWIDRCNNYNNDNNNIDINLYKEIILEVDISNLNTSDMLENKWIRHCSIILIDAKTKETAWESETLELISKEISLPELNHFKILNKSGTITVNFKFLYNIQEDFNYTNENLRTILRTKSIYTNEIIEDSGPLNNSSLITNVQDMMSYTFLNTYTEPIIIELSITNLKGDVLTSFRRAYTHGFSNLSIKQSNDIQSIKAVSYKNNDIKVITNITKK